MRCWTENCKILTPLVLVSLAINILFIGYHIGSHLFDNHPTNEHVLEARIGALLSLLPASAHKEVRNALEAENNDVKKVYAQIHSERRHIHNLVGARRIEEVELRASFGRLRTYYADSQRAYHDAFTSAVVKLPYAERMQVKQKMRQRFPAGRGTEKAPSPAQNP